MRVRRPLTALCAVAIAPLAIAASAGAPAIAAHAAAAPTPPSVGLSLTPAEGTPALTTLTKSVQQVRQIVQCGQRMYAVGKFTSITQGGRTFARHNVLSFSATAPYTLTTWGPNVHGQVNSIAFVSGNCSRAYLGGAFRTVNSRHVRNLAKVSTVTGRVFPSFKGGVNKPVETLLVWNRKHLLTGGFFTKVNGKSHPKFFVSLTLTSGHNDGYLALQISGEYRYRNKNDKPADPNRNRIYNQQLSPTRTRLMVEGDFTSIGGKHREQIAMLNLGKKRAAVSKWYATEFNRHCAKTEPFYAQAAAWSPDGSRVYTATTGFVPANGPGSDTTKPRAGLCDALSAFSSKAQQVKHLWINYTGCDGLYSVAATRRVVTTGGHERWASNDLQCNNNDSGQAIDAQGMVGVSPATGEVNYNPTRGRGYGADDMLVTSAGLWVASDNFNGAQQCGGVEGHSGICLLPATG